LYVGIVHSFSTSAKEKAQLQNTWHNCKTNCTTAKKMHNGNFPLPSHGRNHFSKGLSDDRWKHHLEHLQEFEVQE
jgi:hypothetical protein